MAELYYCIEVLLFVCPLLQSLIIYFILSHIFLTVQSFFLCHVKQSLLFKRALNRPKANLFWKSMSFIIVVLRTVFISPKLCAPIHIHWFGFIRSRLLHGTLCIEVSVYNGVHLRLISISRSKPLGGSLVLSLNRGTGQFVVTHWYLNFVWIVIRMQSDLAPVVCIS